MRLIAVAALLVLPMTAADLKPQTVEAFDRYIKATEQRLDTAKVFLWSDENPDRARLVRQGQVVVQPFGKTPEIEVPDGLIHDWVGAVFIPSVALEKTLANMQDYNHKEAYRPEVISSRLVSRNGNDFEVYMRLLKKKVITVVLDTDHSVHYFPVGPGKWRSISRTTKVSEVEHAGKPDERVLPPGTGGGYLWKLNSYWRFEERDGGTLVECEAVSLTRDVPAGLGWLIKPIIRELPRESLAATLRETREALAIR